jgi:hypothetical protein
MRPTTTLPRSIAIHFGFFPGSLNPSSSAFSVQTPVKGLRTVPCAPPLGLFKTYNCTPGPCAAERVETANRPLQSVVARSTPRVCIVPITLGGWRSDSDSASTLVLTGELPCGV